MSKIRVYELAKEMSTSTHKISSKEIVEKAGELGIPVENHLSQLDETETVRLKKAIQVAKAAESGEVKRVRRSVVRRRRAETVEPEAIEEAPAEAPVEAEPVEEVAEEPVEVPEEPEPVEEVEAAAEPVEEEVPETPVVEAEPAAEVEPEPAEETPPEPVAVAPEEAAAEPAPETVEEPPEEPKPEAPTVKKSKTATATGEKDPPAVLKPTRKKKKDAFTAVVVSMPEEPEPVAARPLATQRVLPSRRQIEKEDAAKATRKKGKKLIYDRRRGGQVGYDGGGRGGRVRRRKGKKKSSEHEMPDTAALPKKIEIQDTVTVSDLASKMALKANFLLRKLVEQGVMATINDTLDYDTAAIIATDLGYEVANVSFDITQYFNAPEEADAVQATRPPVVTIMGHVDHGKTSLLDRIQKTDIAGGEAGGITQSIGAYVVQVEKGKVVFVDTPGHAAFTSMRARGAQVTDIVILVVAADDGVMPQTIEAIQHAKAAEVPIIVAVNKIDKPDADLQRVRRELSEQELLCEEWGGDTIFADVSAKTGDGVDSLLEMLVLQSEVLELSADPSSRAKGIIIESRLEKGRGPVASVVIQEGTLKIGDVVVAGTASGRVRALLDDKGFDIKSVTPSFPAEIIGLDRVPGAGESLYVVRDEKAAKLVTDHLEKKERDARLARVHKPTFEELFSQMGEEEAKVLKVVLKGDTQGSVDAIHQGMEALSTDAVALEVIGQGVGVISENDVNLALASDGIVLGFNVKADAMARSFADAQGVNILNFNLIHELLDKTHALMEGKLEMIEEEVYLGSAEIRQVFNISRVGAIAGCHVSDGKVLRSGLVRVKREGEVIHTGKLSSLKRFKDDVREVAQGFECGMSVVNFNDVREGDIIESFEIQKIAAKL
jgi:translation initiation factor IF-2